MKQQRTAHILLVDDEPINLEIMAHTLERRGYTTESVANGGQALIALTTHPEAFDVILLDRMMPEVDGMEVLLKAKRYDKIKHVPVIMQTAAASKQEIMEGIEAGAYYYLTKPYDNETLVRIVDAAVHDTWQQQREKHDSLPLLNKGPQYSTIRTIEEADALAKQYSPYYPNAVDAQYGVRELLVNAIEHGNLGIGYQLKTELNKQNALRDEIAARLASDEHKHKYVEVTFEATDDKITLTVRDQGDGFDWQKYLNIDPDRATDDHGRGIAISRMRSFDDMEYVYPGNEVTCSCYVTEEKVEITEPDGDKLARSSSAN